MIIEITGPSGSGKSTLIKFLFNKTINLSKELIFITESKYINQYSFFKATDQQNWKTDLKCFIPSSIFFIRNAKFLIHLIKILFKLKSHKISIARSVWRKIGIYNYYCSKKFKNKIIIIDEGILHTIHNIFVNTDNILNDKDLIDFLKLIPKSDITIILKAPLDKLISRLNIRGDLSPRIKSSYDLYDFIKSAKNIYDKIEINSKKNNFILFDTSKLKYEIIFEVIIEKIKNYAIHIKQ